MLATISAKQAAFPLKKIEKMRFNTASLNYLENGEAEFRANCGFHHLVELDESEIPVSNGIHAYWQTERPFADEPQQVTSFDPKSKVLKNIMFEQYSKGQLDSKTVVASCKLDDKGSVIEFKIV